MLRIVLLLEYCAVENTASDVHEPDFYPSTDALGHERNRLAGNGQIGSCFRRSFYELLPAGHVI